MTFDNSTNKLKEAKQLALYYHQGQTDKSGNEYYGHLCRVAEKQSNIEGKIIGYLHDLLEDTNFINDKGGYLYAILDLLERFNSKITQNLIWLTKTDNISYYFYINRLYITQSELAIQVKLADLEDNMNLFRLNKITLKDIQRFFKYLRSYIKLNLALLKIKTFNYDRQN